MGYLSSASATHATNVHHYAHVVDAMEKAFEHVLLQRRWELSKSANARIQGLLPQRLGREIGRRVSPELGPNVEIQGLGLESTLRVFRSKIRPVRDEELRRLTVAGARHVANTSRGGLLHFIEGLGHVSLREERFEHNILERRNLHHEVFEVVPPRIGSFPASDRLDPLRDILEEEYSKSESVIVYSNVAQQSFVERGFSVEKVRVVPLGSSSSSGVWSSASPTGLPVHRDPFKILYVGRGDIFKGIDVAVEAVRKMGGKFRLRVAGPFQPLAKSWLLAQSHVDYLGVLTRPELEQEYQECSVFVAPSVESFGLSLIDAASFGIPVLCRETTGIGPELPEGVVRVIPGRDPQVWADAIADEIDRPSREREREGRQWEVPTWSRASEVLLSLYQEKLPQE